jgi:ABC-type amino acid transport system permease subunit
MSEYIKNSVLNLNSLDVLAARSLGFTRRQEIIYVVLPKFHSILYTAYYQ